MHPVPAIGDMCGLCGFCGSPSLPLAGLPFPALFEVGCGQLTCFGQGNVRSGKCHLQKKYKQ
jgi:hypothetical protein